MTCSLSTTTFQKFDPRSDVFENCVGLVWAVGDEGGPYVESKADDYVINYPL